MPEYRFEPDTGLWYHRAARTDPAMSLFGVSYADGQMRYENRRTRGPSDLSAHLRTARAHCVAAANNPAGPGPHRKPPMTLSTCAGFCTPFRYRDKGVSAGPTG